jgi:hypothetical protein
MHSVEETGELIQLTSIDWIVVFVAKKSQNVFNPATVMLVSTHIEAQNVMNRISK